MEKEPVRLIRLKEAAKRMGLSVKTVRRLVERGVIKRAHVTPGVVLLSEQSVDEYVRSCIR
jgi:excisionase family DNA binding protein